MTARLVRVFAAAPLLALGPLCGGWVVKTYLARQRTIARLPEGQVLIDYAVTPNELWMGPIGVLSVLFVSASAWLLWSARR